jgi:uncharacterized membrane protein YtjA (UPF0391 family)
MLAWALTFLGLALIAAYLGFFGLAGLAAIFAKLFLILFVALLFVSALSGAMHPRPQL